MQSNISYCACSAHPTERDQLDTEAEEQMHSLWNPNKINTTGQETHESARKTIGRQSHRVQWCVSCCYKISARCARNELIYSWSCPSAPTFQLKHIWPDFHYIWYWRIIPKIFSSCLFSFKSGMVDEIFTRRTTRFSAKSRTMRWAGHEARMGRRIIHKGYWRESQKERDHYEHKDVGVDNIKMDLR
jgi:hypothetical protein